MKYTISTDVSGGFLKIERKDDNLVLVNTLYFPLGRFLVQDDRYKDGRIEIKHESKGPSIIEFDASDVTNLAADFSDSAATLLSTLAGWMSNTGHEYSSLSNAFTSQTATSSVDVSLKPLKTFSLQVIAAGATTWSVELQGSLDGTNWFDLITYTQLTTAGSIQYSVDTPVLYYRLNCSAYDAGTLTATATALK